MFYKFRKFPQSEKCNDAHNDKYESILLTKTKLVTFRKRYILPDKTNFDVTLELQKSDFLFFFFFGNEGEEVLRFPSSLLCNRMYIINPLSVLSGLL